MSLKRKSVNNPSEYIGLIEYEFFYIYKNPRIQKQIFVLSYKEFQAKTPRKQFFLIVILLISWNFNHIIKTALIIEVTDDEKTNLKNYNELKSKL